LLRRWKDRDYINLTCYRFLSYNKGSLFRAYGLLKIHKENCSFRLIVSSINSPLYDLAIFLHKIMTKSFPSASSHIDNSFEFVRNISTIDYPHEYLLISLDVVSLFTNIP
ncbi:hypothetical protein EAG_04936, partial [Camponotus floridanus]